MKKWYQKELVRSLVDMHIPNIEGSLDNFDPIKYAENVKKSGATVAYIYSANSLGLSFYPTQIGLRHKAADRDIFGQTVKECRKLGLGVVGYMSSWGTYVSDTHPEWNVVKYDGSTLRDNTRWGNPCVNNDEYIEYMRKRVEELVSMYKLDAVWIDMIGIYSSVCYCEACKRKYKKPLPTVVDLNNPEFIAYIKYKTGQVASYVETLRNAAKEIDPDVDVVLQCAEIQKPMNVGTGDFRYYNTTEFMSGDFYQPREGVNVLSRILYKLSPNLPFEFMTSRCVGLGCHTMNKDINELVLQSYAALMYKGSFLFIDAIDPDGSLNENFYEDISVISENFEKFKPYVDFEEKPLRDVAVYYSFGSDLTSLDNGKCVKSMTTGNAYSTIKKIDIAFSKANIDYDVITAKNLSELKNYKVLILSSIEFMSESEASAIRDFVYNGGCVYASGITSLRDDKGNLKENFMLSDLFGVNYKGKFEISPNYVSPINEGLTELFGRHTRKYPHMLNNPMYKVEPISSLQNVLATVTLPISDKSDITVFSSGLSNPPTNETEYVALCENTYGAGKVIYSAGTIESDGLYENMTLFANIINRLAGGEYRARIKAPSCVDYTVYEKDGVYKMNLLNNQNIYPPIKISDVSVSVKIGDRNVENVFDVTGGKTEWRVQDGVLELNTDLDTYKLIVVKTV